MKDKWAIYKEVGIEENYRTPFYSEESKNTKTIIYPNLRGPEFRSA